MQPQCAHRIRRIPRLSAAGIPYILHMIRHILHMIRRIAAAILLLRPVAALA